MPIHPRRSYFAISGAAAAAVAALSLNATAGPTVVSDEMLRDTRVTPVLGRGYSLATNTFQSTCLTAIKKTVPSYDFDYVFQEVKEDGTVTGEGRGVRSDTTFTKKIWGLADVTAKVSYKDTITGETWHRHDLLVSILIDVYYSSVDESSSKLSEAAESLLKANDVPGFFDACGMYYTRSISRQGSLVAIFSYETTSKTRDLEFEASLKASIRGWGAKLTTDSAVFDKTTTTVSKYRTTIHSLGFGLGKSEKASLIAWDEKTFKESIKDAFMAMQAEDVGMVTAVEVVPWVENPQFQIALALKAVTVPETDSSGEAVVDDNGAPKMKTILPYAQKRILTENSEFLSEVDRAARAKLGVFYKSKQCKQKIMMDHMKVDRVGVWSFLPDHEKRVIVNNRHIATIGQAPETMTLGQLYNDELADTKTSLIFREYDAFVYGGQETGAGSGEDSVAAKARASSAYTLGKYPRDLFPGAIKCVADLLEDGALTTTSYRKIDSCRRVEEQMSVIGGRVIDDFCMPNELEAP